MRTILRMADPSPSASGVGEVAVVVGTGHLVDAIAFAAVVGADRQQVLPTQRAVGRRPLPLTLDDDPAAPGEGHLAGSPQPGHLLPVARPGRRLAVGVGPLEVMVEVDDRNRLASVSRRPAAVG